MTLKDFDQAIEPAQAAEQEESATSQEETTAEQEQASEQEESSQEESSEPEVNPAIQKRFDKLVWQREEARREKDKLAEEIEKLRSEVNSIRKPKDEPSDPKAPRLEDFDYDQDRYHEALIDYKVEVKISQDRAKREKEAVLERQRQESIEREKTFIERKNKALREGLAKYEDYEEAINAVPGDVLTKEFAEIIVSADNAADVAYYIATHPEDAQRISAMNSYGKAMEVGIISASLSKPKKTTTQAPPPPNPLKGSDTVDDGLPDPDKDPAAWIKARNEGKI